MVKTSSTSTHARPVAPRASNAPATLAWRAFRRERRLGAASPAAAGAPRRAPARPTAPRAPGRSARSGCSPASGAAGAQRHRYQAYLPGQWLQRPHRLGQRLRHAPPAFVLEQVDRVARGAARARPRCAPGSSPAGQAAHSRHSRSPNAGWPQRAHTGCGDRLPARAAELAHQRVALTRRHRRLAQEARRRQQPALDPGERLSEARHRPPRASPRPARARRETSARARRRPGPPAWSARRPREAPPRASRAPTRCRRRQ